MAEQAKQDSDEKKTDNEEKGKLPHVRDAGPRHMKDKPVRKWGKVDQESDESFPASDPPGNY